MSKVSIEDFIQFNKKFLWNPPLELQFFDLIILIESERSNHNSTFGATYLKESLDDYTSNKISDLTHVENEQWSVFGENEWAATDDFKLTAGLRYDHDGNFAGHWSPRLYGVYSASKAITIKGGISTGFRAPNIRQSTAQWGQVSRGGNIYGNPDLKPEQSVNYEMGVYYDSGRDLSISTTVFYNEFDDKITRIACPLTQCTPDLVLHQTTANVISCSCSQSLPLILFPTPSAKR